MAARERGYATMDMYGFPDMCKYCNLFRTGEGKPRESFDHSMGVPVNGVPLTVADMDKVGDHDRLAYHFFRHIICHTNAASSLGMGSARELEGTTPCNKLSKWAASLYPLYR